VDIDSVTPLKQKAIAYDEMNEEFYYGLELLSVGSNWVTVADIKNIRITEVVETHTAYDDKASMNRMYAKTSMNVAPLVSDENVTYMGNNPTLYLSGSTVRIQSMTIDSVSVHISDAIITGDVVYEVSSKVGAEVPDFCVIGKLTVEGFLVLKSRDITVLPGTSLAVTSAKYTVKNEDNTVDYCYASLQRAIDNGATKITLMTAGPTYFTDSLIVPKGVELTLHSNIRIGIYYDAVITIADGAKLIADEGLMVIVGALVIENNDYGISMGNLSILADVKKQTGACIKYMCLDSAMKEAKSGETVEIYRTFFSLDIDRDITVPEGVTFDAKNFEVFVNTGYTLTVNGTMIVYSMDNIKCYDPPGWGTETPSAVDGQMVEYPVLKVGDKGRIIFKEKPDMSSLISTFKISAAYYYEDDNGSEGRMVIAGVPGALESILDVYSNTVYLSGDLNLDALVVKGTEVERFTVNILPGSEVSMKSFAIAYGAVTIQKGVKFAGDIGTDTGRIIFRDATAGIPASGSESGVTFEDAFIGGAFNLMLSGYVSSSESTDISGTVYFNRFFYDPDAPTTNSDIFEKIIFRIPAGSELIVAGHNDVDGYFETDGDLRIEGKMTITNRAVVKSGTVTVFGTLDNQRADGKAGHLESDALIEGGSLDCFKDPVTDLICILFANWVWDFDGTAEITGEGSFDIDVIYVFNGETVSAPALRDGMDGEGYGCTEFYIGGASWMKAYAADGYKVPFVQISGSETLYLLKPELDDAEFISWQTYDKRTDAFIDIDCTPQAPTVIVGQAGYEKVYANIDRHLYNVEIVADMGIDNVYIDGKLITKDKTSNIHTEALESGTYIISYTLANGYSGNAAIISIDGKQVSGSNLTFSVDRGTYDADADKMVITLSGIQKSGYDTDLETHPEQSAGLSVTEILLIVAVIIMAMMAVVLILRLNRN